MIVVINIITRLHNPLRGTYYSGHWSSRCIVGAVAASLGGECCTQWLVHYYERLACIASYYIVCDHAYCISFEPQLFRTMHSKQDHVQHLRLLLNFHRNKDKTCTAGTHAHDCFKAMSPVFLVAELRYSPMVSTWSSYLLVFSLDREKLIKQVNVLMQRN